jgi:DNA-binding ferritin-like protein
MMYRKPRFLKVLHAIREEMSREVDYDVDLFAEKIRAVEQPSNGSRRTVRARKSVQAASEAAEPISLKPEQVEKTRRRAAK